MTRIISEITLDQPGKHQGFLRVPHSVHRSAYGWIPVPIVSVKHGSGPVVLLMAGNHGDEYEGQVALTNLTQQLQQEHVSGQIIILTMANYPAAHAGLRTSPLDQGNLNRSFPGDPGGTPTEMIADYIESELLSRADYLFDIHSGGSSLEYKPTVLMARNSDPEQHRKNIELIKILDFPVAVVYQEQVKAGYSTSAGLRQNAVSLTAEMAGGGGVNHGAVKFLEAALERYLGHLNIIAQTKSTQSTTEFYETNGLDNYIYARYEGVFEPLVEVDDTVVADQIVGLIHHPETPWEPAQEIRTSIAARVICKRVPARVERGDCLFELATPLSV